MNSKILSMSLAAGLMFGTAGLAAAQSDKELKPNQLQQNQQGASGTEAGTAKPAPGAGSSAAGTSGSAINKGTSGSASGATSGNVPNSSKVGGDSPTNKDAAHKPDEQKK